MTHANPLFGQRKVGTIGIPLPSTDAERVQLAYRQTLSRDPNDQELARALDYVAAVRDGYSAEARPAAAEEDKPSKGKKAGGKRRQAAAASEPKGSAEQEAWTRLYQALIESAEFRYRG